LTLGTRAPIERHALLPEPLEQFAVAGRHTPSTAIDWLEMHADTHRWASLDAEGPRWLAP
jgi:hypothetical protein